MFVREDARRPRRPYLCGRHHNRLGRENKKFTSRATDVSLCLTRPWCRGNEGRVLACRSQSLRVSVWPSSRPVGNEAEQYVYVSAFDLDRQLSCPRVHDDDRRRRVFLFYYAGKPYRVTDIIKLIAKNSVDSNLVGTFNELQSAQVHRRGSGWRTFEANGER